MATEERGSNYAVHYTIIGCQIGLPVVWLAWGQEWAKAMWVGMMAVMSVLILVVLVVRALALRHKSDYHQNFKFDRKMMHWPKQVFFLSLNCIFAFIMAKYAEHPLIASLIMVSYFAMIYEAMFNNGENA